MFAASRTTDLTDCFSRTPPFAGLRAASSFCVFLCLLSVFFVSGCSRRTAPPIPKTHPELVLEVFDSAKKDDFKAMLPKVERLRAIDPSSVFLSELETVTRFNILVGRINLLSAKGDFAGAVSLIDRNERVYGPDKATESVRSRLLRLMRLDSLLASLRRPGSSATLEKNLDSIDLLSKKIELSEKISNFVLKKRSELALLKRTEYNNMLFGLYSDALTLFENGGEAAPLAAALEIEDADFPGSAELLSRAVRSRPEPSGS